MDKQLTDTGDTVVDMEIIREVRRLKDAVATLQIGHCRIMEVYDEKIETLQRELDNHCHCTYQCECN